MKCSPVNVCQELQVCTVAPIIQSIRALFETHVRSAWCSVLAELVQVAGCQAKGEPGLCRLPQTAALVADPLQGFAVAVCAKKLVQEGLSRTCFF